MMASTTKIVLVIRVILGILSLVAGLFFLYKSSLSKMQFGEAETVKTIVFVSLSPLFVLLLVMASKFIPIVETHLHLNSKKAIVNSFLFAVICLLIFWIKNPGFGIHYSQRKNNPCVSQQVKTLSRGNAYNLFALITFSFLPLIVAWKRKQTIELGYFSILLGLTMENSMEIQGTYGPNLWYILVAAFCCIGLIFSRGFLNSLIEKRNNYHSRAQRRRSGFFVDERRIIYIENCLATLLVAVGAFFLSKGSFFQDQFVGIAKWAGIFFLVMFAFLLLLLVVKAPTAINMVAKACQRNSVVKTIVNCCLLAFVSGVNFLKKYPKFKMQSMIVQSCFQQQNGNVISFGSYTFDLYSAGLFALFSMIVASARLRPVEFGISSFLLELTMDASIEIFGNHHRPKFGYLLGASFYCVFLIFMRSYHDSVKNADDEYDPDLESFPLMEPRRPRNQGASDRRAASENIHLREGERKQERESSENAEESHRIVHNAEERPVERKLSQTDERNQNGNSGNLLAWASRVGEGNHIVEGLRKRKTTTRQSIISESKLTQKEQECEIGERYIEIPYYQSTSWKYKEFRELRELMKGKKESRKPTFPKKIKIEFPKLALSVLSDILPAMPFRWQFTWHLIKELAAQNAKKLQDIRTRDCSISTQVPKSLRQPRTRDCFRGKHLMGKKSLGKNIWNRRAFDGKRKGR